MAGAALKGLDADLPWLGGNAMIPGLVDQFGNIQLDPLFESSLLLQKLFLSTHPRRYISV